MRKIPRNLYAGDKGDLLPETSRALKLAGSGDIGEAQTQLCRALATERLVVSVPVSLPPIEAALNKLRPGEKRSVIEHQLQRVSPHFTAGGADSPLPGSSECENRLAGEFGMKGVREDFTSRASGGGSVAEMACASESLETCYSPFGRATIAYSSAERLQKLGRKFTRPTLMNPSRVALVALAQGGNLWLDPQHFYESRSAARSAFHADPRSACETIILGRNALSALACGDDWLAPWNDAEVAELIAAAVGYTGCEVMSCEPFPAGGLNLRLRVPAGSDTRHLALGRFQRALMREPKLTARVTYFSLTPA